MTQMIGKFFLFLFLLLIVAGIGYLIFVDVPIQQRDVTKEITLPIESAPAPTE